MNAAGIAGRSLAVIGAAAAIVALYTVVERPWLRRWGATDAEVRGSLPGDDAVPGATDVVTRAITIAAPRARVWPWVAQLGQDRAGFYSYDILENLVGCEMPHLTRILPDRQAWTPGDRLWMYPPQKLHGVGGAPLVAYRSGAALVFATRRIGATIDAPFDGSWGFHLAAAGSGATRLIQRTRGAGAAGPVATVLAYGIFEPAHFVMERRMMTNIRALAEGRPVSRFADVAAVVLWTVVIVLMIAALVMVFRVERWGRPLGLATLAALVFQFLSLVQPPTGWGLLAVLALVAAFVRRPRQASTHGPRLRYSARPFTAHPSPST
jgi:MYXO-CTERM domain-containing protein